MSGHLIAMILAVFIDYFVGDPPHWPHPVKWFGKLIAYFDANWNHGKHRKFKGMMMVTILIMIVYSVSFLLMIFFYRLHPVIGVIFEAIMISTTIAQKSLKEAALAVFHPLQQQNLQEARVKLSYIVGRDTESLTVDEVARGAVETVAENTSDGITAPLFWSLLGGAPLALVYRLINTCDSMVGYRNEKYQEFGFASARLDDVLNYVPSRITALIMLIVMKPKKSSRFTAWKVVIRDAKKHPSPNSGWGEAAVASILGIQLGGLNYYQGRKSFRAKMGDPLEALSFHHILHTVTIMKRTTWLFLLVLVIGGMLFEVVITWR